MKLRNRCAYQLTSILLALFVLVAPQVVRSQQGDKNSQVKAQTKTGTAGANPAQSGGVTQPGDAGGGRQSPTSNTGTDTNAPTKECQDNHPSFAETPSSDSAIIKVNGYSKCTIIVYQANGGTTCEDSIENVQAKILPATASNGKTGGTSDSTPLTGNPPFSITLASAPTANGKLCLKQQSSDGLYFSYSVKPVDTSKNPIPVTVSDANNPYPYVRTFYTAGVLLSNQNNSSSTNSTSEYVDLGLRVLAPIQHQFGKFYLGSMETDTSARFSDLPVSATGCTSSSSSSSGSSCSSSTTVSSINILSTQSSGRILGSYGFNIDWGKSDEHQYVFSTSPIIKAGVDTLFNPSASKTTSSTSSSSTTTTTIATATFSPAYWEFSTGLRFGLYNAVSATNRIPALQVDVTMGKYANLQSYICKPNVIIGTTTTQPTTTSCYTPQTSGASSYSLEQQSRATIPRIQVEGFVKIPSTSFVIGLDANMPQEQFLQHSNLDALNKPGGNIAIYLGLSGPLSSLFNNIKQLATGATTTSK